MASVNPTNTSNAQCRTNVHRVCLNMSNLPNGNYSLSRSTISTLAIIMAHRRTRTIQVSRSVRSFHDNTSPSYEWLLPGWLAEEHQMPQGRIYRYYLDPSGNMYRSQEEVIMSWEQSGLVVILDD